MYVLLYYMLLGYNMLLLRLNDNDVKFFNEDLVKIRLSLSRSSAKNYYFSFKLQL